MKIVQRFLGVILFAIGVVWFLQGMSVLPGSFMSGQRKWALIGAITAAVGAALWRSAIRRRR
jgi:hypothetical protein